MPLMPMAPMSGQPGGSKRDDERSEASALLEGEATEWVAAGRPSEDCEGTGGVVTGAVAPGGPTAQGTGADNGTGTGTGSEKAPSASKESEEELPDDRVGVPQRATDDEEEDTEAWYAGAAMFTPLLLAAGRKRDEEDEEEIFEPGYSSEDRETWGSGEYPEDETEAEETAGVALTSDGEVVIVEEPDSGPQLATWQPSRAADSTGAMLSGNGDAAMLSCGVLSATDEYEEEEESEDTEEETEDDEASSPREIADLLLQEDSAWGTAKRDRNALL
ncbi:hypothetical protein AQJ91_40875 [Streptomyces dysideae]|uniref:Uncharacterized protein n=1 Tax=Streptomyces dysideae TaxID=909626 RepID=A0A101URK6_9ACTN|nr:hypothetical protein AQJ91_40875 [Streptomyces dysideae]